MGFDGDWRSWTICAVVFAFIFGVLPAVPGYTGLGDVFGLHYTLSLGNALAYFTLALSAWVIFGLLDLALTRGYAYARVRITGR